jgi:hypothetical protein
MSAGRPQRPLRVHTGGRWANVGRTSVRSVRSPRTPACHRRQRGHVCRTQPVRTVVIPEAADGQSADCAGSLRLPLLLLKAGPAAGSDTAVIGETASPSTRHGTNLSPAGYAAPTSAGVTVQADSRSSAPWPCRCSADLGTGSRHAGHGTRAQRSDDDADATAAPTSQPRVTDNTGHQRAANAQLSRSPRPASQVVRPPRFSLGQGDSLPAARLGRLPTRQVVVVNGPHPPVQLVTIAATLERVDNTDHYRSASPQLTARIPPGAAGPGAPATVPSGARRSALGRPPASVGGLPSPQAGPGRRLGACLGHEAGDSKGQQWCRRAVVLWP